MVQIWQMWVMLLLRINRRWCWRVEKMNYRSKNVVKVGFLFIYFLFGGNYFKKNFIRVLFEKIVIWSINFRFLSISISILHDTINSDYQYHMYNYFGAICPLKFWSEWMKSDRWIKFVKYFRICEIL